MFYRILDTITSTRGYHIFIASIIMATAIVQLFAETISDSNVTIVFRYIFQTIFSVDIILRVLSAKSTSFRNFFLNPWNMFDIAMTFLVWFPIFMSSFHTIKFLQFLNVLRLLRVLKTFSFVTDLGVIMNSVSLSTVAILYSMALLLLALFYFACAGTLLFHNSSPYHFDSVPKSISSLLQIMTLDNWSAVMWVCILGCRYYPYYNSGLSKFDSLCSYDPVEGEQLSGMGTGVGWWGALYFVVFIIFVSMVIISLLVGIIITCMELLRQSVIEENNMWEKVKIVQKTYEKDEFTMNLLLELFNSVDKLVDKELNGSMTFNEMTAILDLADLDSDVNQHEFFMKVDIDGSGQIDFAEFCEMIILIGKRRANKSSNRIRSLRKNFKSQSLLMRAPSIMKGVDEVTFYVSDFYRDVIDFLTTPAPK